MSKDYLVLSVIGICSAGQISGYAGIVGASVGLALYWFTKDSL